MTTMIDSRQVGIEDLSPLLWRDLGNTSENPNSGVINENVNPSKLLNDKISQPLHLFITADITNGTGYLSVKLRSGAFNAALHLAFMP